MISIIHPSRGRFQKSYQTICQWCRHAIDSRNIEVVVSVDEDDPELESYKKSYGRDLIVNKNRSAVDAINAGAAYSRGDILMVVSDDTASFPGWKTSLLFEVEGKTDWILKTQDGIQPWIITMPIMDRVYYNRFGYIYHPDYLHMFCDTELSCVADITGRRLTSNLMFPHKHYSVTHEHPDAVNKKADATWAQGEKVFLDRYERNFDLPPGGKIGFMDMINWLKRKNGR